LTLDRATPRCGREGAPDLLLNSKSGDPLHVQDPYH
jgi:hypothetical protein